MVWYKSVWNHIKSHPKMYAFGAGVASVVVGAELIALLPRLRLADPAVDVSVYVPKDGGQKRISLEFRTAASIADRVENYKNMLIVNGVKESDIARILDSMRAFIVNGDPGLIEEDEIGKFEQKLLDNSRALMSEEAKKYMPLP